MLQWMGGSRRKVTTSRKSTQKRQKQYFEQRKRQQQQQDATDNFVDDFITRDHQKGNRSLDISSLHNVTKVTEECKPLCVRTDCDPTLEFMYSTTYARVGYCIYVESWNGMERPCESVANLTNKAPCPTSVKNVDSSFMRKSDSHSYSASYSTSTSTPAKMTDELIATECTVPIGTRVTALHQAGRVSSKSPRENTSTGKNIDSEYFKSASSVQHSIFDIIGDDGPIGTTEERAAQEAHVAFSIEGLGNVGTETPMQSPKHPGSTLEGEQSSFTKAAKKFTHKNFNSVLDDLEMEMDHNLPSHHRNLSFSSTEPELLTFKDGKQFDFKQSHKKNSLLNEDIYENLWNDSSTCLEGYQISDKCGVNEKRYGATDKCLFWRNDLSDYKFKEGHSPPSLPRCQERTYDRFDNIDEDQHLASSFDKPKYSSLAYNYHPQDILSPMKLENMMDNLTSFSGESCSSTAVGGESTADMPSARLRRRYSKDLDVPSKRYAKEGYDEGMWNVMASTLRQDEECNMSRKHMRLNSSHLKSALYSQAPINECGSYQLFEEEFPSPKMNLHPESFFASFTINQHQRGDSSGFDKETDFRRTNCHFDRFENDTPKEFSSENFAFHQPCYSRQSYNTSFVSKADSGDKPCGVFGDIESGFPSPELSAQGSVVEEGGDRSKSQPSCPEKFFQVSSENRNTTPESRSLTEETNLKDYGYGGSCKMTSNGNYREVMSPALEEDVDTTAEETSLSMKLHHESDDELNTPPKELQGDIPALSQHKIKAKVKNDDNFKGSEPKTTLIDPCYHLMTVERYVIKLFSVPKGKATAWNDVKLF